MKRCCALLLAALPLCAFAYPIDVQKNMDGGANVAYTTYDTDYDMGSINLRNDGETAVECTVRFQNGPEAPRTRRVTVPARASADVNAKFTRSIIKLRIGLSCKPSA
ncbi:MAG: 3-phosphoglycerate kinase [Pseudomonas sp.]|uniref:3-phosphoglycerate kinase n=1 Tax=Pseudomonas abieticivorans TaxID=2931382 RepID=UPI0020C0F631|nr:3-phosphoglycerate kinase [Pseudomonas sp. PIA16]MDE1164104.1 3-phosphoglycerate kinase [Pseudomonas sp.]